FKLNKKVKSLARISALSSLVRDNKVSLVESIQLSQPKTKDFTGILSNLNVKNKKALIVTAEIDQNLYLSSRNLSKVKVSTAANLNTYDLLNSEALLLTEESVNAIEQLFNK
ncbi:MAG: 50S ribosomal protein L4, partial [Bacteroidota bacterium]|nr:50S ribosomal protein L4 [Bacteroidota bacterium]